MYDPENKGTDTDSLVEFEDSLRQALWDDPSYQDDDESTDEE